MAEACGCRVSNCNIDSSGMHESYEDRVVHCPRHSEAHVAALETERDGWKHRADSIETQRDDYWRRRLSQLEAALRKYGQHLENCPHPPQCTCGLTARVGEQG